MVKTLFAQPKEDMPLDWFKATELARFVLAEAFAECVIEIDEKEKKLQALEKEVNELNKKASRIREAQNDPLSFNSIEKMKQIINEYKK